MVASTVCFPCLPSPLLCETSLASLLLGSFSMSLLFCFPPCGCWPPWNIHYNFILCFCHSIFLALLRFPFRICVCGWNLRALGYRHTFVFSVSKVMWGDGMEQMLPSAQGWPWYGRWDTAKLVDGENAFRLSVKKECKDNTLHCPLSPIPGSNYIMALTKELNMLFRVCVCVLILTNLEVGRQPLFTDGTIEYQND